MKNILIILCFVLITTVAFAEYIGKNIDGNIIVATEVKSINQMQNDVIVAKEKYENALADAMRATYRLKADYEQKQKDLDIALAATEVVVDMPENINWTDTDIIK